MSVNNPYLEYWQKRQKEQQEYNQKLAQEARKNLPPVIDYLKKNFPITKIILFGSLVKGKFQETSDIDLAVAGLPEKRYFQAVGHLLSLDDFDFDLVEIQYVRPEIAKAISQGVVL